MHCLQTCVEHGKFFHLDIFSAHISAASADGYEDGQKRAAMSGKNLINRIPTFNLEEFSLLFEV